MMPLKKAPGSSVGLKGTAMQLGVVNSHVS